MKGSTSLVALCAVVCSFAPADSFAGEYFLKVGKTAINVTGQARWATTLNATVPGQLLHWHEGEDVAVHVTNTLDEPTAIHWHGILLPINMDGVPGMRFNAIAPGTTYTYRFKLRQNGTYWYHSHADLQEQAGMYAPIVIDPTNAEALHVDRDYVVMFADWTDETPQAVYAKLKKQSGYYNFNKRTAFDFFSDVGTLGLWDAMTSWSDWTRMRMDPTDIADVTAYTYTYLINGRTPIQNWTALFKPGERIRLRLINAAAMTFFDVRIPGLKMTVIQADGQDIEPVTVDEFRISVAETYDVIVTPSDDRAYTLFAETMDRSGYARATLAPREGMLAPIPERRPRPLLSMADMGMHHGPMGHAMHGTVAAAIPDPHALHHGHTPDSSSSVAPAPMYHHGQDTHGPGTDMVAFMPGARLSEPGIGLDPQARRVLVYTDLRSARPRPEPGPPTRDIELHITGNMQRFMWSFDGIKYADAAPIQLRYGERVRFTLINDTMMNHPIHLHGLWSELENGMGTQRPLKHVINVKPAEKLSFYVNADALGEWAFHCHLLYHMEAGMFRKIIVAEGPTLPESHAH
jgi:CopA family copper-resistance protein